MVLCKDFIGRTQAAVGPKIHSRTASQSLQMSGNDFEKSEHGLLWSYDLKMTKNDFLLPRSGQAKF